MKTKVAGRPGKNAKPTKDTWELRLYVAGQTPKSLAAFANLKKICEEHLEGKYHIEVVDLLKNPQLAQGDQILAIPTLVRKLPPPIKKIIGDLYDAGKETGRGPTVGIATGVDGLRQSAEMC